MKHGFRHIKAFLYVAQEGSFTRAAKKLHISQPALTIQIQQLEDEFGLKLLNRDRRTVSLTQAGSSLLPKLRQILDIFESATEEAQDLIGIRQGSLAIAVLPSVAAANLPKILGPYKQKHPNIEIKLADAPADKIIHLVKNGDVELGIGPWASRDRAIQFKSLFTDVMHVFFPNEHPLNSMGRLSLKQLIKYPHILTTQLTSVRKIVQQVLEDQDITIEVACEAAYLSTAISMIKAGLGISILPLTVLHAASCDGIAHRPIIEKGLSRDIGFITLRNRTFSPAAKEFMHIAEQFYIKNL